MKKNRAKNGIENLQLFIYAFCNEDFISQGSPILADVENKDYIGLESKKIIKFPSLTVKVMIT